MKTAIISIAGQTAAATGLLSLAALSAPSSDAASGWLLVCGLSVAGTLTTIAANWVIYRNRNKAVEISQPLMVEFRRDLATKDDIKTAKAFTGRVEAEHKKAEKEMRDHLSAECRRLYDKLDTVEKSTAEHTADIANLRESVRDLRRK
jgi:polyhydroxyalkanoate synthesis regulator phasin